MLRSFTHDLDTQSLRNLINYNVFGGSNAQKLYNYNDLDTQELRNLIKYVVFIDSNVHTPSKYNDFDTQGFRNLIKCNGFGTQRLRYLINITI